MQDKQYKQYKPYKQYKQFKNQSNNNQTSTKYQSKINLKIVAKRLPKQVGNRSISDQKSIKKLSQNRSQTASQSRSEIYQKINQKSIDFGGLQKSAPEGSREEEMEIRRPRHPPQNAARSEHHLPPDLPLINVSCGATLNTTSRAAKHAFNAGASRHSAPHRGWTEGCGIPWVGDSRC